MDVRRQRGLPNIISDRRNSAKKLILIPLLNQNTVRYNNRTPPVEAHRPVVTYLQFPTQVCFPCNDHAQPAADKAPTEL